VAGKDAAHIAQLALLPPPRDTDRELANRLFGVREPEPDFEDLIRQVQETLE
jgi:hypothetical protein